MMAAQREANRKLLYVGGLAESVVEETLHAAFIPFGEVVEVTLPREAKDAHRGFAFVEFKEEEDANEARFNMDGAELFGRALRVSVAKATEHRLGSSKPVWSADSWFQNLTKDGTDLVENAEDRTTTPSPALPQATSTSTTTGA